MPLVHTVLTSTYPLTRVVDTNLVWSGLRQERVEEAAGRLHQWVATQDEAFASAALRLSGSKGGAPHDKETAAAVDAAIALTRRVRALSTRSSINTTDSSSPDAPPLPPPLSPLSSAASVTATATAAAATHPHAHATRTRNNSLFSVVSVRSADPSPVYDLAHPAHAHRTALAAAIARLLHAANGRAATLRAHVDVGERILAMVAAAQWTDLHRLLSMEDGDGGGDGGDGGSVVGVPAGLLRPSLHPVVAGAVEELRQVRL